MDQTSLGPLTFRQRSFWLFAFAVLLLGVAALVAVTWPTGCGCEP